MFKRRGFDTAPEKSAQYGCERVAIADRMHCDRQTSHRGFHIFAFRLASQCDTNLQATSKWEWPDRFTDKGLVDVVSNFQVTKLTTVDLTCRHLVSVFTSLCCSSSPCQRVLLWVSVRSGADIDNLTAMAWRKKIVLLHLQLSWGIINFWFAVLVYHCQTNRWQAWCHFFSFVSWCKPKQTIRFLEAHISCQLHI